MADTIFYYSDGTTSTSSDTIISMFSRNFQKTLLSVNIGDIVTSISGGAFDSCVGLTYINIPDNVLSLGINVFANCSNLKKVIISKNITILPRASFFNCSNLLSIYFYGNAPSLGLSALSGTPSNLKIYRKKNSVTGWGPTLGGKLVVLWSDNVIKSGGTGKLIGKLLSSYKPIITFLSLENGINPLPEYYIELYFDKNGIADNLVKDYQVDIMQVEAECNGDQVTFSNPPFDPSINSPKISNNIEYANLPISYLKVRIRAVGKKSNTFSQWSDPYSAGTSCL